ncbi:MAG: beta-galactosidase [Bryobacteraceae bacterium]
MRASIRIALLAACVIPASSASVLVFWEEGFPTVDSQPVSRQVLEQSLKNLNPRFVSRAQLRGAEALQKVDLLVLPYGSAFPAELWPSLSSYLEGGGNLLVLGGRPFTVPVSEEQGRLVEGRPQQLFSGQLGISETYEAPLINRIRAETGVTRPTDLRFLWDDDFYFLDPVRVAARRVFVLGIGRGQGYRGMGFLVNPEGRRVAAPVSRQDFYSGRGRTAGGRRVYLHFEPEPGYWSSQDGISLIRQSAEYAAEGATRLWLEMENATIVEGEIPQAVVHAWNGVRERSGESVWGTVEVELRDAKQVRLATAEVECRGHPVRANVAFREKLAPGVYFLRGTYKRAGRAREAYHTGFWQRDLKLLHSGSRVRADGHYFRKDDAPFVLIGTNYMSSDIYSTSFVAGGNHSGNVFLYDRDFGEMKALGLNFVRTGTWHNQELNLDRVTGFPAERFLRMLEAYLHSAARHGMQVQFTFFAFDPQTIRRYPGEQSLLFWPGTNPYTDPLAVQAEKNYVYGIVSRFKDVPFLSWDLINEPSFSNNQFRDRRNDDPTEVRAWQSWLREQYKSISDLAAGWQTLPERLGDFSRIRLPLDGSSGQQDSARVVAYRRFTQDAFNQWAREMIQTIRAAGSKTMITVGQDEKGVTTGILNQFYGSSGVDFTVNHSWDWGAAYGDALLWDSVAAKRPDMPNIIGETSASGNEVEALGLLERKLVLGYAAGTAGVLHWWWLPGGSRRTDGSSKIWEDVMAGIAQFVQKSSPYFTGMKLPETAIVFSQSFQLSPQSRYAIEAQQRSVRALFHHARSTGYVVGEYQIKLLGSPKLILLPSPWSLHPKAWELIRQKVEQGATLLVTGRFDADEHFRATDRGEIPNAGYRPGRLTRETFIEWPEGKGWFSFSGDKCRNLPRGYLDGDRMFAEQKIGKGKILYFAVPIELNDDLWAVGSVYRYALRQAGVSSPYQTELDDPGILICPTQLERSTLYVLTSESPIERRVTFTDNRSKKTVEVKLAAQRGAMLMIRQDGEIVATYNVYQ